MKQTGIFVFSLAVAIQLPAQQLIEQHLLLRDGTTREWTIFPENKGKATPSAIISFDAKDVSAAAISLVQYDVNHNWQVTLNDKPLGTLAADEQRMTTYFNLPAGILKRSNNKIKIAAAPGSYPNPDDIIIEKIVLHNRIEFEGHIRVNVSSGSRNIPSKIVVLNAHNALQPVKADTGDTLAVRTGIIYSGTGNFSFSVPAGTYKVYASRGFEYGVDSTTIQVSKSTTVFRQLNIKHEVNLPDQVSVDTHVHTLEFSGHGDASMQERILTIAGEGLDYAVITEHNKAVNIKDMAGKMAMTEWFTPITGDELTTRVGHFNIFPVDDSVPSPDGIRWSDIATMRKSNKQVIILNHARDVHGGFRPADTMFNVSPSAFPSNAMEVMNSGSQQTNPRELYTDWMRLMTRGIFLTPIGSSDSHDVSRFIVGQGRTYVSSKGDIIDNFLNHKAAVSFGLYTDVAVDTGRRADGKTNVTIKIHSPSWVRPANLALFANGQKIYTSPLTDKDRQVGNFYMQELNISLPPHQVTLVAIAEGPDPKVPWWPIAKPYQHVSPELEPIILGISAPQTIN